MREEEERRWSRSNLLCGGVGALDAHGEDGVTAGGALVALRRCCRARSVGPPQEVVDHLS
eukprot:387665-Hanusia_phi.AAC.1